MRLQVLEHPRDEADICMSGLGYEHQVRLEGFKARTLRDEQSTPRHLYATEWCSSEHGLAGSAGMLLLVASGKERHSSMVPRRELDPSCEANPRSMVVAIHGGQVGCQPLYSLEAALALVQKQPASVLVRLTWLLGDGPQLGLHPNRTLHAGVWGLARSARTEASLPLCCMHGSLAATFKVGGLAGEPEIVLQLTILLAPRLTQAPRLSGQVAPTRPTVGSQLITGGTSGLGMLTGRWLAQGSACALILASRRGVAGKGSISEWVQLQACGSVFCTVWCDTSQSESIQQLVSLWQGMCPILGVWHAAGVLADGTLPRQSVQDLLHVCACKAHGGWVLHLTVSATQPRTCFLFSSVASLLGAAGQANYSAANACLDALSAQSHAQGCASVSVQWGAWAEVGMAARGKASERVAAVEVLSGFARIGLAQGLTALGASTWRSTPSVMSMVPVAWTRVLGGGVAVPAFLSACIPRNRPVVSGASAGVCSISLEGVLEMVKSTVGGSVDADDLLMEAGMDSLGAVELHRILQQLVGGNEPLPSNLIFDHPTGRQVAEVVQRTLGMKAVPEVENAAGAQLGSATKRIGPGVLAWQPTPSYLAPHRMELSTGAGGCYAERPTQDLALRISTHTMENVECATAPKSVASSGPRIRLYFMHGYADNAVLVRDDMECGGWLKIFEAHNVEVIIEDGPYAVPAEPSSHLRHMAKGLYDPDKMYRAWQPDKNVQSKRQYVTICEADMQYLESRFEHHAPIHAIGGLSLGGLLAAQVASQRPSLAFFLNVCGLPWEFFPPSLAGQSIQLPTLHVLSEQVPHA